MSFFNSLFGKSKEQEQSQVFRDRLVQVIAESSEIVNNSKNIKTVLSRAKLMKDRMDQLKEMCPNDDFVAEYYDTINKMNHDLEETRRIYDIIEEANELYKKKELGDKYYDSAINLYKQAIERIISSKVFIGEPPLQPFKRYIAYLKKNKRNDEIDKLQSDYEKIKSENISIEY